MGMLNFISEHTTTEAQERIINLAGSSGFAPNFVALLNTSTPNSYAAIQQLIDEGADPSKLLPATHAIRSYSFRQELLSEGTKEVAYILRDGNDTIASSGFQTASFTYELKTPGQNEEFSIVLVSPKHSFEPLAPPLPLPVITPPEPPISEPIPPTSKKPTPEPSEPEPPTSEKPTPEEPDEPEPGSETPDSEAPDIITPVVTHISIDTGNPFDGITSDNTLYFFGTAGEHCTIEVFIDGVSIGFTISNGQGMWVLDYTKNVLPDGDYTITAQSTNLNGTKSPVSENFPITVDTEKPIEPELWDIRGENGNSAGDGFIDDDQLIFSGKAEPEATIELFLDGTSIGTTTTDSEGNWVFDNTHINLADGSYTLTLTSFDKAGNSTPMPYEVPFEVNTANHDLVSNSNFLVESDNLFTPATETNQSNKNQYDNNNQPNNSQTVEEPTVSSFALPEPLNLQDVLSDQITEANQLIPIANQSSELPSTASNDEHHNNALLVNNHNNLMDSLLENYEQNVLHG
ncbi:Ig-like domain-containing protein [Spartinivicinus ruber]|uniref:Ig-like domain-containing protein n=1 Tax=Spartinivicinus ruber TaxID=2683272 RepID=UPI0013D107DF|nr:Ig-like domain-containing protein [Spartinivicinus ruber]